MDIIFGSIGAVILCGGGVLLGWFLWGKTSADYSKSNANLQAVVEQNKTSMAELPNLRTKISTQETLITEKNNRIFQLETQEKQLQKSLEEVRGQISKYQEAEKRKDAQFTEKIEKLDHAKESLEKEKDRVTADDKNRRELAESERARIWNEHENSVIANLKEICQKPEIGFNFYDNTSLPESFDGSLKPDFLIEVFPEQYLIFDAKFSESKISTYFTSAVPKTVEKIQKSKSVGMIYPTIFFVVPNDLLQKTKKLFVFEKGFSFFMISLESLAPILSSYKKITEYEFAGQLNPQDRENIVNVLSNYESFIRNQNAANILIAEKAVEVIGSKQVLTEELLEEINLKRKNIKPIKLKETEMRKLTQDIEEHERKLGNLMNPQAKIEKEDLDKVKESLF